MPTPACPPPAAARGDLGRCRFDRRLVRSAALSLACGRRPFLCNLRAWLHTGTVAMASWALTGPPRGCKAPLWFEPAAEALLTPLDNPGHALPGVDGPGKRSTCWGTCGAAGSYPVACGGPPSPPDIRLWGFHPPQFPAVPRSRRGTPNFQCQMHNIQRKACVALPKLGGRSAYL
eukprot:353424-Chlamydomonas_euryale.AAC.7